MLVPFIHLRCKSSYSVAEGAVRIYHIPKLCLQNQMPALGIADSNNLFGVLDFSETCIKNGLQPIIGYDLTLFYNHIRYNILLIATNEIGYNNLVKISSDYYLIHNQQMILESIYPYSDGLIILSGGERGLLHHLTFSVAEKITLDIKAIFHDRFYIELMRPFLDSRQEHTLLELAYKHNIPLVATNDIFFEATEDLEAHDILLCIANKKTIHEKNRIKSSIHYRFKSSEEMGALFADVPEAIFNTEIIAKRCSFYPKKTPVKFPPYIIDNKIMNQEEMLQVITIDAQQGLNDRLNKLRYDIDVAVYYNRLCEELEIIKREKLNGYFLIVADFVQWAHLHKIPVGPGRGSGVGSIVAWSLGITDVDPIKYDLLFERFINPHRVSLPDFDIDFCQDKRNQVIQYVIDKYGKKNVAQIITFGKLQARAAVRDVGRALGMAYGHVEKIVKLIPFNPTNPIDLAKSIEIEPMLQAEMASDTNVAKLMEIAKRLEGLCRNVSIHAAGIVIISDEEIARNIPFYLESGNNVSNSDESTSIKETTEEASLIKIDLNMPVTQFDLKWIEYAGLLKFDFLGLRTLTVIQKTIDLLQERNIDLDLSTINMEDERVFVLLSRGLARGIFQLEGKNAIEVLRTMRPDRIDDLIAITALLRPGPMDYIPDYIARKKDPTTIQYLHPLLEPILSNTYGIIVYQEQVMQIARTISGYSLGEADILRRIMGKKIQYEMDEQQEKFINGAIKFGIEESIAKALFQQIESFAHYAFNKSHATAYAIITYYTAYLKTHYTLEFVTAHMIYDADKPETLMSYLNELRDLNITLLAPNINASEETFKIVSDINGILCGLNNIKGVGINAAKHIVHVRKMHGNFTNFNNFMHTIDHALINKRQIEALILAGAFDGLHNNRKYIFEQVSSSIRRYKQSHQIDLFHSEASQEININIADWEISEKAQLEFKVLGFYITAHPITSFEKYLQHLKIVKIKDLVYYTGYKQIMILVVIKKIQFKVSKNKTKYAFVTVSDETADIELRVMHEQLQQYFELLKANNILLIFVSVMRNESGIANVMMKMAMTMNDAIGLKLEYVVFRAQTIEEIETIKMCMIGNGHTTVSFILNNATIKLNDKYTINAEYMIKFLSNMLIDYRLNTLY